MTTPTIFVTLILLTTLNVDIIIASKHGNDYVRDACSVTKYPTVCIRSLSSFSCKAKRSSHRWARAAVSFTLGEAKSVRRYLGSLRSGGEMRGREGMALLDCIECFGDTVHQLRSSLFELRRLNGKTFERQMGNVETWVSAALSYEDSCSEGLKGRRGKEVRFLRGKVVNVTQFTSNALSLVNKLASDGGAGFDGP
ncbi:pectinesterase inhibitor 6-like [Magnolia sinica]|uniref:pectinesterase inhibitor 6-like n=1 Tax=Magnolia sinica TaxID=86752 RepID=UPI00265B4CD0|nr:pectinesterase inhibitor 6-like [Magnolia sinica]